MNHFTKRGVGISLLIALGLYYISFNKPTTHLTMTSNDITKQFTTYQVIQTGEGIPQSGLEYKPLKIGGTSVLVEVADNAEKQRVGLMFRANLPDDRGMLFIFDYNQQVSFWMQNTYIGLDLLYVGSDSIIKHIHNNAKPLDLTGLPSIEQVKYVIEVNDMFVEKFGIQEGDRVEGL